MPKFLLNIVPSHGEKSKLENRLTINGQISEDMAAYSLCGAGSKKFSLVSKGWGGTNSQQFLADIPLEQLSELFCSILIDIDPKIGDIFGKIQLVFEPCKDNLPIGAVFWPSIQFKDWAGPFSLPVLSDEIRVRIEAGGIEPLSFCSKEPDTNVTNFGIAVPFKGEITTLQEFIEFYRPMVAKLLEECVRSVLAEMKRDSLVTFFEFPQTVRTACQQYLLYFVQFLSDLGIDADAELKEDAQRILFSVTPRDNGEALERIQEALQAFLSIPGSSAFNDYAATTLDIAGQQLAANVMHLQSQLALARAIDQAKSATIETLQLANFQYRQMMLIQAPEALSSIPKTVKGTSEREELLGGIIAVTPLKVKGFEINLPKILRLLKRRFR
jgi:hypothetical protein